MPTDNFTFLGFVPRIKKDKKIFFERINSSIATSIFYESPKRIKSSINFCSEIIKNRKISIVRELTKKNEEIINGDIISVKKFIR
jgi:16S rRNA (cytidine1402-2'-O)-methyltransferase